jgi:hypothetical protein
MGDAGSVSLFGKKGLAHDMFADHLTSEYSVRTEGRGRVVDEWQMRPGRTENHFWDCLVGCAVAASEQGVIIAGTGVSKRPRKPKISLAEIQRKKNQGPRMEWDY